MLEWVLNSPMILEEKLEKKLLNIRRTFTIFPFVMRRKMFLTKLDTHPP